MFTVGRGKMAVAEALVSWAREHGGMTPLVRQKRKIKLKTMPNHRLMLNCSPWPANHSFLC